MIPDLTKYIDMGGTVIVALMALWAILQVARIKKNGSSPEMMEIRTTLTNHMTDYHRELQETNHRLTSIEMDIKIIKESLEDIKIKLK